MIKVIRTKSTNGKHQWRYSILVEGKLVGRINGYDFIPFHNELVIQNRDLQNPMTIAELKCDILQTVLLPGVYSEASLKEVVIRNISSPLPKS